MITSAKSASSHRSGTDNVAHRAFGLSGHGSKPDNDDDDAAAWGATTTTDNTTAVVAMAIHRPRGVPVDGLL
ncbi:hypothetical protein AB0K14_14525 [Actinosynnema sp. NPDC050801]|uniref:hypothetical protein n=1 Tax=unclassified Actinosynnema TaxID=2637065 RepID=UPI0033E85BC0